MGKPVFFFGDSISTEITPFSAIEGEYKWVRRIKNHGFFLPEMTRMHSLHYLQSMSVLRLMHWDLTRLQTSATLGMFVGGGAAPAGSGRNFVGLHPGLVRQEFPTGETPKQANLFINKFMRVRGEFPAGEFRTGGWMHRSTHTHWWSRMVEYVLTKLQLPLERSGLYHAVRAVQYGIPLSTHHFFAILELYNSDTCTFFTPVGELGFALHEMFEVSGLPMGELPYEEFVPTEEELNQLKAKSPEIYNTYWEVLCHFFICGKLTKWRSGGLKQISWAKYLFNGVMSKNEEIFPRGRSTREDVQTMLKGELDKFTSDSMEGGFPTGSHFHSYFHQAKAPLSEKALLAGFFMLRLKRCVVPTLPHEALSLEVVYPAVLLAHGQPLSLLTAMVSCMQSGLRFLSTSFCNVEDLVDEKGRVVKDRNGNVKRKTPNPRIELPYTYLMAWYVMHYPSLMTGIRSSERKVPYVQLLEDSDWACGYMGLIRRTVTHGSNYQIYRCSPDFSCVAYGEAFEDVPNRGVPGWTSLPHGVFFWLISIRPGYLILRQGAHCSIEPYMPCRFARQFGYEQLYVGNPNMGLSHHGNLLEGARAWFYTIAGCTGAKFSLPPKVPSGNCLLSFCNWYCIADSVPRYNMHSTCIREIKRKYYERRNQKNSRMKGMQEYLMSERNYRNLKPSDVQSDYDSDAAPSEAGGATSGEEREGGKEEEEAPPTGYGKGVASTQPAPGHKRKQTVTRQVPARSEPLIDEDSDDDDDTATLQELHTRKKVKIASSEVLRIHVAAVGKKRAKQSIKVSKTPAVVVEALPPSPSIIEGLDSPDQAADVPAADSATSEVATFVIGSSMPASIVESPTLVVVSVSTQSPTT